MFSKIRLCLRNSDFDFCKSDFVLRNLDFEFAKIGPCVLKIWTADCGLRTADCGLRTGYRTSTRYEREDCEPGIKRRLGVKRGLKAKLKAGYIM